MLVKRKTLLIAILLAVLGTGLLVFSPKSNELTVTFLDVGQGDCTVIRTPSGMIVMIDGGGVPETDDRSFDVGAKIVIPYLRAQGINRVDLMIASHPHEDHISGLISVMNEISVKAVMDSGLPDQSEIYLKFRRQIKSKNIPYYTARSSTVIRLDNGVRMTVLHPKKNNHFDDCNDSSLVIRMQYHNVSVLFTGDCGQEVEESLCKSKQHLRSTVLKVGHHGSASSTGYPWLKRVRPGVAIISVGKDNLFGHPSHEVLRRLEASGCRIYRTDLNGAVILRTDGRHTTISPFKQAVITP